MSRPESTEGPTDIRVRNLPSDIREGLLKLKRANAILGGPTDYKDKAKLEAVERLTEMLRERLGQLQQEAGANG